MRMHDVEIARLAVKCGLGAPNSNIFNLWDLPLTPITTDQLIQFGIEMYKLGWEEGMEDGKDQE